MGLGEALAPLRERRFRLLWLGRVSSAIGDALVPVALTFAVLSIDRSGAALGAVLAAFGLSRIAFTLAGGVVADRVSRRTVMLTSDVVRGSVHAFTAAMLLTHHMTIPLFVVTEAVFGTASAFFGPAADGLVPQTTTSKNLQPANALLGISRNTMNVFGPTLSGLIVATAGAGYVFAIDAASFAASALFLVPLHVDGPIRGARTRIVTELREGFHEVASRPWVRVPLAAFAISNVAFASFIVLGPLIFLDHFAHAKTAWGLVSTFGSIGAIVGALLSVRIRPVHPLSAAFVASTLIAVPIAALSGPLPVAVLAVAWGFGMGAVALANTWWETTLQRRIPEHVYSRVRSYDILVSFVFMPIGLLAFGPIGDVFGYEPTLLVAAGIAAVTNVVVAFSPAVRAEEAAPNPAPAT